MAHALTKLPRILFFVNGTTPTLEQQLEAEKLAPCRVSFRNALLVSDEGALETCDGVAGEVPARYKEKYPTVRKAIEKFEAERKAAYEKKKTEGEAAQKAALDKTAKDAEGDAKKAAEAKKKADEEAAKAKADADAKAKAAAAWKPNA